MQGSYTQHSFKNTTMLLIFVGAHLFFVALIGLHRPLSSTRYFGFETRLDGHENCQDGE